MTFGPLKYWLKTNDVFVTQASWLFLASKCQRLLNVAYWTLFMFYLVFYSTQDLTHDAPAKNELTEVVYIPVMMIIAPMIMFTIMHACLQESHY